MFKGANPISGEDLTALPIKEIGPAIGFYRTVLGFTLIESDESTSILQRDSARIGLVKKPDHKPEEAGSFAIGVTDLNAIHEEPDGRGLDLGGIRIDEWDGKKYRVFFLRESENGYCFCFTQPA
jgi:lactoylglutathione lyase